MQIVRKVYSYTKLVHYDRQRGPDVLVRVMALKITVDGIVTFCCSQRVVGPLTPSVNFVGRELKFIRTSVRVNIKRRDVNTR